jgi:thioredoxin 1
MKNGIIILAVAVLVGGVAFWRNRCPCAVVEPGSMATADAVPTSAGSPGPGVADKTQPGPVAAQKDAPVASGTLCPEPPPTAAAVSPATQAALPTAAAVSPATQAALPAELSVPVIADGDKQTAAATAPSAPDSLKLPRVVDLGADKCIPCKQLAPILAELKKEYDGRVIVEFIDVWKNRAAGEPYKIRIIPTQVFFDREGKEVWRHEGFLPKADFIAKFAELGVK